MKRQKPIFQMNIRGTAFFVLPALVFLLLVTPSVIFDNPGEELIALAVMGALILMCVGLGLYCLLHGIEIYPDRLCVRRFLIRREYSFDELDGFEYGGYAVSEAMRFFVGEKCVMALYHMQTKGSGMQLERACELLIARGVPFVFRSADGTLQHDPAKVVLSPDKKLSWVIVSLFMALAVFGVFISAMAPGPQGLFGGIAITLIFSLCSVYLILRQQRFFIWIKPNGIVYQDLRKKQTEYLYSEITKVSVSGGNSKSHMSVYANGKRIFNVSYDEKGYVALAYMLACNQRPFKT